MLRNAGLKFGPQYDKFIYMPLSYYDNIFSLDVVWLNSTINEWKRLCSDKWKIKFSTYFKTKAEEIWFPVSNKEGKS